MNKARIEAAVIRYVDHVVVDRGKIEDSTVEAKGEWPDADKAQQLAGLANAARGQSVLLIIGLCEKTHAVVPLGETDLAEWWPKVQRQFAHGAVPHMTDVRVYTDHGVVLALHFQVDQPPYMVKTPNTLWIDSAVPWRDGTRTRSATRAELLSLLQGSVGVPSLEFVAAHVALSGDLEADEARPIALRAIGIVFVESEPGNHVVLPRHRREVVLRASTGETHPLNVSFASVSQESRERRSLNSAMQNSAAVISTGPDVDPYGVTARPPGLVVLGSDLIRFKRFGPSDIDRDVAAAFMKAEWVEIDISMPVGTSDRVARVVQRLNRAAGGEDEHRSTWLLNPEDVNLTP